MLSYAKFHLIRWIWFMRDHIPDQSRQRNHIPTNNAITYLTNHAITYLTNHANQLRTTNQQIHPTCVHVCALVLSALVCVCSILQEVSVNLHTILLGVGGTMCVCVCACVCVSHRTQLWSVRIVLARLLELYCLTQCHWQKEAPFQAHHNSHKAKGFASLRWQLLVRPPQITPVPTSVCFAGNFLCAMCYDICHFTQAMPNLYFGIMKW